MDRLIDGFNELFQDLIDDCKSFDEKHERKSKDIAGRIRTLLKDGPNKKTISVLKQLDRKDILFKDSAIEYTKNPGFSYFTVLGGVYNNIMTLSGVYMGLVYKNVNDSITPSKVGRDAPQFSFGPLCNRGSQVPEIKERPFDEWWDQIIYEDHYSNYKLSRKDLILSSSEKDGYAHFDPMLDEEYKKFLQADSLELVINGEKIRFINNPAKNSIRQIGFEVILTLKENLSDLIK